MSAAVITSFVPDSSESTAAIERYQGAYRATETAVRFGETIRLGGVVLADIVLVGGPVEFLLNPVGRFGFPVVFASFIACAVSPVLPSHILSVAVHGQGELLKATLGSAINSSPVLSNAQRAKAMLLRKQPRVPESIAGRAA